MLILRSDKLYRNLGLIVMAILGVLVLLTFQDYGLSWDEEIQSQYGQGVFDYYASGFVDHRYKELFNLYIYGGMFDGLAAFFNAYTPMGIYPTRHLLNAIFGLLAFWGTWRLGRLVGGPRVGFFSLFLLAVTPMFYGHIYNNPKDIPFAAGILWTIYYMGKSLRDFPHVSLAVILRIGLIFGLTLGVRVGGVMLLGYWGLALLVQGLVLYLHPSSLLAHLGNKEKIRTLFFGLLRLTIPAGLAAYAVMLLCWPWAQEAPLMNPILALIQFSNFPQDVEVLLDGTIYMSTKLPWHYLPEYLSAQLPVLHLVLLAVAVIGAVPLARRLTLKGARATLFLILLMAVFPALYAILGRPALYDAIRHFIFTLPLLCIMGASAFVLLLDLIETRIRNKQAARTASIVAFGALLLGAGAPVAAMVRLHPYEYIYVNGLHGGVPGAYGKFELDYWGTSFKEAAEKLQTMVEAEGGVPPGKIYKIAICGPWAAAMNYLPPDYEPVMADDPADFFLATTRWMCQDMRPGKEAFRVERMGVPLSILKDLRTTEPEKIEPQQSPDDGQDKGFEDQGAPED